MGELAGEGQNEIGNKGDGYLVRLSWPHQLFVSVQYSLRRLFRSPWLRPQFRQGYRLVRNLAGLLGSPVELAQLLRLDFNPDCDRPSCFAGACMGWPCLGGRFVFALVRNDRTARASSQ